MSSMPSLGLLLRPPYIFLILGLASFSAGLVWTFTGKAWVRFHGWVYRAKEPKSFWWQVVIYYLVAAFFVGFFLFTI